MSDMRHRYDIERDWDNAGDLNLDWQQRIAREALTLETLLDIRELLLERKVNSDEYKAAKEAARIAALPDFDDDEY